MASDFGIILTTYIGDYYLTKALLASIKKYMPEMPICIIQDGDFSLEEIKKAYNITHIIKKETVKNEFIKENCFRSRCSNLAAFSESPFEKFLFLDSDIVLWGNILKHVGVDNFDFVHNEPHEPYTDKIYREQYFVPERLFKHTEGFEWKDCHFFNSGTFIAKKNMFDQKEIEETIDLRKADWTLLPSAPQSFINLLVFRNKMKGKIKVGEAHLQTNVPVLTTAYLEKKFVFANGEPVVNQDTVIHWAGLKPLMMNSGKVFLTPEVYFRKLHLKNIGSIWRFVPVVYFYYEEVIAVLNVYHNGSILTYLKRKILSWFKK